MRVAVIGAGNVGGTLGRRWAALGHEVVFGVRAPEQGASAVKGGDELPGNARVASVRDAIRDADVVVLATPWGAVPDTLEAMSRDGGLDGVVLVDATNPLGAGMRLVADPEGRSGAEQVQALAPKARVVKAFNTTGFGNMREPVYDGHPSVMFVAGDDAESKRAVLSLARDLGFDAVDAGGLQRAHELEHLAVLWISLAMSGHGREIAFRLMRR